MSISEGKKTKKAQKAANSGPCDECMYFDYDEDYEEYYCSQSALDEDDYSRMVSDPHYHCPFFRRGNEYTIVKKQI